MVLLHRESNYLEEELSPEKIQMIMEINRKLAEINTKLKETNQQLKRVEASSSQLTTSMAMSDEDFERRMSNLERKFGYTWSPQPTPMKHPPTSDLDRSVIYSSKLSLKEDSKTRLVTDLEEDEKTMEKSVMELSSSVLKSACNHQVSEALNLELSLSDSFVGVYKEVVNSEFVATSHMRGIILNLSTPGVCENANKELLINCNASISFARQQGLDVIENADVEVFGLAKPPPLPPDIVTNEYAHCKLPGTKVERSRIMLKDMGSFPMLLYDTLPLDDGIGLLIFDANETSNCTLCIRRPTQEDIHEDILLVMLSNLGRDKKDINSAARKLAMDVIKRTAEKLEPEVKQFLISSISGLRKSTDNDLDFHEVIYGIYHCAPNILLGVISYLSVELLTDQVDVRLKALNLVRAGVEMTLIDAAAKSIDLPLWQLFGGAQNTITTDITVMIPIVSPAEAFELAAKYRKLGFETLKSKVGNNLNADIEVLKAIREVHPDCLFILDANEGFSSNETIEVLEKLYEIGVTPVLFEQPVHRDDWDGLGLVTRVAKKKFGVPVAADESCRSLSDVMRIVNGDLADVINIKLAKLGLLEALNIIKVARESGLSLMIGGMVETRLAMGFAGHLAAGLGCFKFIDLDTPLLLAKDPVLEGYEALGAVYKFTNAAGNGSFLSVEQNSQRGNIHW